MLRVMIIFLNSMCTSSLTTLSIADHTFWKWNSILKIFLIHRYMNEKYCIKTDDNWKVIIDLIFLDQALNNGFKFISSTEWQFLRCKEFRLPLLEWHPLKISGAYADRLWMDYEFVYTIHHNKCLSNASISHLSINSNYAIFHLSRVLLFENLNNIPIKRLFKNWKTKE
jgi:hypothetical protein